MQGGLGVSREAEAEEVGRSSSEIAGAVGGLARGEARRVEREERLGFKG